MLKLSVRQRLALAWLLIKFFAKAFALGTIAEQLIDWEKIKTQSDQSHFVIFLHMFCFSPYF